SLPHSSIPGRVRMPRLHVATGVVLLIVLSLVPDRVSGQAFPGTPPWPEEGDPAAAMVEGMHRFLDRELAASVEGRQARWKRGVRTAEAYVRSIAPNRERLRTIIGAVGERVAPVELSYVSGPGSPAKVAENDRVAVYAVRWSVYPGVDAEGLMLEPKGAIKAN